MQIPKSATSKIPTLPICPKGRTSLFIALFPPYILYIARKRPQSASAPVSPVRIRITWARS